MRKINYANVNLTCAFQQMTDLPTDHCIGGVLSRTENSFKFEEVNALNLEKTKLYCLQLSRLQYFL